MNDMILTSIIGEWTLFLPAHRTVWSEWPDWETPLLTAMHQVISAMVDVQPAVAVLGRPDIRALPSPLVYDIGSEEGDMPALWAQWGARVSMFEPDPRVWANIRAVWQANYLPDPFWCFAGFAASDHHIPDEHRLTDISSGRDVWPACACGPVIDDHGFCNLSERPDLPRTTIDLAPGAPDIITLDVEGAELEVLHGATDTLATARPVVFVSIHPEFMRDMYNHTPADVHKFMASHGYIGQFLAVENEELWVYTHPLNQWPIG